MARSAKVIDTRGVEYQGPLIRRGQRQFAVFREPASPEFPEGEYVVHRFIPHIMAWLPTQGFRTEAEAVARIEEAIRIADQRSGVIATSEQEDKD